MAKRIVIVTDCTDVAYNELRGVIFKSLEYNGVRNITIEPVAAVKPFSLINGAFILRLMSEVYPPETIFLVVLNPMKQRPERIFGRTKKNNFLFIGANTGIFDWFLKDFGLEELYELHDPGFFPFGGKYVHAPAVAKIVSGMPSSDLGRPFPPDDLKKLEIPNGAIVHIDNFGLIKFNYHLPKLKEGEIVSVRVNGREIHTVYTQRMMSRETGEWTIYNGSSFGLAELGKVRQDGAAELGVKEGDIIEVVFL